MRIGTPLVPACPHNFGNLVLPADIAGIDPEPVHTLLKGLKRQPVIKVDVGDERQLRAFPDRAERPRGFLIRHSEPHDLAPRLFQVIDLIQRLRCVAGVRVAHGLDSNRRTSADPNGAEGDLFRVFAGNGSIHVHQKSHSPLPSPRWGEGGCFLSLPGRGLR